MMDMRNLSARITGKYRRTLADRFCRRMALIKTTVPIISFTFDDAPKSAFNAGSDILRLHGARATFFVSLGLLDSQTEAGTIASQDDLIHAVQEGNELGCHTFDHLHAWRTSAGEFTASIERNIQALDRMLPGMKFRTFAYPKSEPKPSLKSQIERYFCCCRGGGQTSNVGMVDLNLLKAYFLDRRTKTDLHSVKNVIDRNASSRGWLIFATHDVTDQPSPYGCSREFFEKVVEYAADSGALILPVGKAWEKLQTFDSPSAVVEGKHIACHDRA